MFDFGISVIYLDSLGYIGWGPPSGYLKSFVLSFLFFIVFCLGAPLAPGPFSSGAPGHCPPMPPSRYATESNVYKFALEMLYPH